MTLDEAISIINTFKDDANQPVDSGIKHILAGLLMNGYTTSASCEGHPEKSKRCYPFIILNHPETNLSRTELLHKNLTQQKKLSQDLEEFYKSHEPQTFGAQLIINSFGAGIAEIKSFNAEFIELEKSPKDSHHTYLKELQDFGIFLIQKQKK